MNKLAALAALLTLANDASGEVVAEAASKRIDTLEKDKTKLANEKGDLEGQLKTEKDAHASTRTNLANEKKTAQDKYVKERKTRIDLLLDNAIGDGRLTPPEKAGFLQRLENEESFEAAATELAGKKPTVKTTSRTADLGAQKLALANERERSATLVALVREKQASGLTYDQAYTAVQREHPELFEAMAKPTAK